MTENRQYRERIYPSYTSVYTPQAVILDDAALQSNANALMARMRMWLPADHSAPCLDVACGAGGLLFALRRAGYRNLSGVDRSTQQVSVARKICPHVEEDDVISYLSRYKGQFALITAFDIIEHLDKDEVFAFLDAIYAALRPGGRVIIQTPNADSPWFGTIRYGDFTHEVAFTPENLARVLKVVGFESYQARECSPYFHGFKSGIRAILWRALRVLAMGWNLIETGARGSGVFTRVFIAKADKMA